MRCWQWPPRYWSPPPTWPSLTSGESLGTKAFFAAIIGGFNNSRGALLGGLIVGVCENLAAAYISPAYKDAVALVIFMVVILFKPQGLLGKKWNAKSECLARRHHHEKNHSHFDSCLRSPAARCTAFS